MTLENFTFDKEGKTYISKDAFLYDNGKIQFWYRIKIDYHEYQPSYDVNDWKTRYNIIIVVDDQSRHPKHRGNDLLQEYTCGFFIKTIEKKGQVKDSEIQKLMDFPVSEKIESKIKVRSYQKIKGILNGTPYYV